MKVIGKTVPTVVRVLKLGEQTVNGMEINTKANLKTV